MMSIKNIFKKSIREIPTSTSDSIFTSKHYVIHNIARLSHLDSLGIDFKDKSILEFGAGIGDHTYYLLIKGANVYSTDGRPELVESIKFRFPVEAEVIDCESQIDKILELPRYDIIYCYGFLYHISNPSEFLDSIKDKSDLLLLETCVSSDHLKDDIYQTNEDIGNITQAKRGVGCRPTRNWIFKKLKENYKFVYIPKTQPNHPEFPKDWTLTFERTDTELIRAVFIGSNYLLENENLLTELPKYYI